MRTRMCDLPPKLVGEKILTKLPITSLREVRSTCKLWEGLSKDWILGKEAAAARQQFLGFMTMDSKVCSLRFNLRKEEDAVDLSIKQVDILNQVEISKVFHCDGLLLCVAKDNSRLVAWNPYLGQTRAIGPRKSFHRLDSYALGYDNKTRNHKILRFLDYYDVSHEQHLFAFEIYDFSSNSWRNVEVRPDWEVDFHQRGLSLKGNTYFFAHEKLLVDFFDPIPRSSSGRGIVITDFESFLLCFDFTRETIGPRLPLPFHSYNEETVSLSCLREDQLAVLYQQGEDSFDALEVWVTTRIEPNDVSWSKFLKVDMRPLTSVGVGRFDYVYGSFFIDEEEKVAVVFDVDGFLPTENPRYHTALIIGEEGYFKSVSLGEAPNIFVPRRVGGYVPQIFRPPLVCSSSYLPSLVQINQPRDDGFRFVSCKSSKC